MKSTIQLLDDLKKKLEITSDYALAKHLELSRAQISKYRCGRDFLSEDTAMKVADMLHIERGIVLAWIAAERSRMPSARAAWVKLAAQLGTAAAVVAAAIIITDPLFHDSPLIYAAALGVDLERLCIM